MPERRRRGEGRRPSALDRRTVLRASAGLAAASLLGAAPRRGSAQTGGVIAGEWVEAEQVGFAAFESTGEPAPPAEPVAFATDFPFYAIAPNWSGDVAPGAAIELSLSGDGENWTEPVWVVEAADGGPPERDGRRFGRLVTADGASFVRYRAFDSAGNPTTLPGLTFSYFDASAGPTLDEVAQPATAPSLAPPPIISRAAWGADESYRYNEQGKEIWPPEYQTVEHVVVHHTDTTNFHDPLLEIRSVYYYHAVTRGWGDIGYNYLVDFMGNVYEGRAGGENVVAGHAYGYNRGTSGIGLLGRFFDQPTTPEMETGLTWIVAWVGRALDPFAKPAFQDIPSLPTICAHRDVNPTTCPGDACYGELAAVRDGVGAVLAGTTNPAPPAPEFVPGDQVVTTGDGGTLREGPGRDFPLVARIAAGEALTILDGPTTNDGHVWYQVQGTSLTGWVAADLLARSAEVTDAR